MARQNGPASGAPDDQTRTRYLDPDEVRVFRDEDGRLFATVAEELTVLRPRFLRVHPLTDPDRYLAIVGPDPEGKDFGLLRNWRRLDRESRDIVNGELNRRYLHPVVKRIMSLRDYFGVAVCVFDTDRGLREATLRDVRDNVIYLGQSRILLTDAEGNRYDIRDVGALDAASKAMLAEVL
jgi:hypothetical protein